MVGVWQWLLSQIFIIIHSTAITFYIWNKVKFIELCTLLHIFLHTTYLIFTSGYSSLFAGDVTKRPPSPPPLASGGLEGGVIAVPVEELLHHPDSAAGAQTAHDDEREQPALPATRRPGVRQLRLLLPLPVSHTLIYTHTKTYIHR